MGKWYDAKLTAYHPDDIGTSTTSMEGRPIDASHHPLHYYEDYDKTDMSSFVTLSADNSKFKYGDKVEIQEFPGYRFQVRDNGDGFNNKTGLGAFDIAVKSQSLANKISGDKKHPRIIHWKRVQSDKLLSSNRYVDEKIRVNNSDIGVLAVICGLTWLIFRRQEVTTHGQEG